MVQPRWKTVCQFPSVRWCYIRPTIWHPSRRCSPSMKQTLTFTPKLRVNIYRKFDLWSPKIPETTQTFCSKWMGARGGVTCDGIPRGHGKVNCRCVQQREYISKTWAAWKSQLQKVTHCALAGVAQWMECQPENQRVDGSISQSELMPGLWARSPVGGTQETTTHWCFSPSLSPFLLSKNK